MRPRRGKIHFDRLGTEYTQCGKTGDLLVTSDTRHVTCKNCEKSLKASFQWHHGPKIATIKQDLLNLLRLGKKSAVTAEWLSNMLGLRDGITSEVLRLNLVKPMIEEDLIPIGSCPKGYYIIETKEELNENFEDLANRIRGMQNRRRGLQAAWDKHQGTRPDTVEEPS